jgi:rsbT co-antagonist protein RsbR
MGEVTVAEFATILDSLGEPVFVYGEDLRLLYCNAAAANLVGLSREAAIGKHCYELLQGKYCHTENCTAVQVKKQGRIVIDTVKRVVKTERSIPVKITAVALKDAKGKTTGTIEAVTDLSELQALRERDEMIRKLSTPLVQVAEGVVLLPVVGILDSARAKQLTESVLGEVGLGRADVIVMDISGIAAIDTKTANHLLRTIQAVRLMGSDMIITGLRPDVAVTLVTLGIDLSGIVTRSTLMGGLEYAYAGLGFKLIKNSKRD